MYNTGSSSRCPACGLVNFQEASSCKRCGRQLRSAPPFGSPYSGRSEAPPPITNPISPTAPQAGYYSQPDSSSAETRISNMPDTPSPPSAANTAPMPPSFPSTNISPGRPEPPPLYLAGYASPYPQGNQGTAGAPPPYGSYDPYNSYGNSAGPGYPPPGSQQPYPYPNAGQSGQPDAAAYAAVPNPYGGAQFPAYGSPYSYYPPRPPLKQGLAIASMIVGIVGIVGNAFCFIGTIAAPAGLVLGIVSMVKIRRYPEEYSGKGFAIAGLVTSSIGIVISLALVAFMIFAFMSGARQSQIFVNEEEAVKNLNAIAAAERSYRSSGGQGSYGAWEDIERAGLVNERQVAAFGYRFTVVAIRARFEVFADPDRYGSTGYRSFYLSSEDFKPRGADKHGGDASFDDQPVPPGGVSRGYRNDYNSTP